MPDTEAIDKLFLELSQFTNATTAKELALRRHIGYLNRLLRIIKDEALKLPDGGSIVTIATSGLNSDADDP